jgi:hypothetical protein
LIGTGITLRDFEDDSCHELNIMISTAVSQPDVSDLPPVAVIMPQEPSGELGMLAAKLSSLLTSAGNPLCQIETLSELESRDDRERLFARFLLEFQGPFLSTLSAQYPSTDAGHHSCCYLDEQQPIPGSWVDRWSI